MDFSDDEARGGRRARRRIASPDENGAPDADTVGFRTGVSQRYTAHAPRHTTAGMLPKPGVLQECCPSLAFFVAQVPPIPVCSFGCVDRLYYMHLCAQVYEDFGAAVEPGVTAGPYHT